MRLRTRLGELPADTPDLDDRLPTSRLQSVFHLGERMDLRIHDVVLGIGDRLSAVSRLEHDSLTLCDVGQSFTQAQNFAFGDERCASGEERNNLLARIGIFPCRLLLGRTGGDALPHTADETSEAGIDGGIEYGQCSILLEECKYGWWSRFRWKSAA
ncbi:hypothetical protein AFLA_000021 [Aspergillus flavus NRRL3357]|nr:hypothetical protein AFLA_000021 [Aspergillus flavus NRRL3357]